MQVRPIIGISKINSVYSHAQSTKNHPIDSYRAENFSNINETSGRYLAFKGTKSQNEQAIADFIDKKINPFLEEFKEINNKNQEIYQSSKNLKELYESGLRQIKENHRVENILQNDPIIIKNLTIPINYKKNLMEFNYLAKNDNNYIMSDETKNFIKLIEPQMHNAKLDSYNEPLKLLDKVIIDIKNGQSNAVEHTSADFNRKIEGIKQANDLSEGSLYLTDANSGFKNRFLALQKETNVNVKNKKIADMNAEIPKHNKLLSYANEVLRGRTEEAETLMNYNKLTKDIVMEQLKSVDWRYKTTAHRNLNVLHKYFNEHPEFKRSAAMDKKDDEFLKKQEYLNVKLWQHLQDDIKDFRKDREQDISIQPPNIFDDCDLPF